MGLAPIDLLHQEFRHRLRGYEPAQVDEFLRTAATALEEALKESTRLAEEVRKLEAEVQRYRDIESTLKDALVLGQTAADELKAAAHREADLITRESQERVRRETEQAVRELEALRTAKGRFLIEFRSLLRSYLDMCEDSTDARRAERSSAE